MAKKQWFYLNGNENTRFWTSDIKSKDWDSGTHLIGGPFTSLTKARLELFKTWQEEDDYSEDEGCAMIFAIQDGKPVEFECPISACYLLENLVKAKLTDLLPYMGVYSELDKIIESKMKG
jgi:hypothetical protein